MSESTTAECPFSEDSEMADLVIRSGDNIDFFVLKALLCIGSKASFFSHLFTNSQPAETRNGLPILELPETSQYLRTVLLLCHPLNTPVLECIETITTAGEILRKYCLDMATRRLQTSVIASKLVHNEPLRVFAIAVHNSWKELGVAAARHTLDVPLDQLTPIPELGLITALDLAYLMEYHRDCARSMQSLIERRDYALGLSMSWMSGRPGVNDLLFRQAAWCKWCKGRLSYRIALGDGHGPCDVHQWPVLFVEQAVVQLERRPCPEAVMDETLLGKILIQSIADCNSDGWKAIAYSQVHAFARILASEVERRVSLNILKVTGLEDI